MGRATRHDQGMPTAATPWPLLSPTGADLAGRLAAQARSGAIAVVAVRETAVDLAGHLRTRLPGQHVTLVVAPPEPDAVPADLTGELLGLGHLVLVAVPGGTARPRAGLRPVAHAIAARVPGFTVATVDEYGIVWLPATRPVCPERPTWLAGGRTAAPARRRVRRGRGPGAWLRHGG